jgi:hypothetical protein
VPTFLVLLGFALGVLFHVGLNDLGAGLMLLTSATVLLVALGLGIRAFVRGRGWTAMLVAVLAWLEACVLIVFGSGILNLGEVYGTYQRRPCVLRRPRRRFTDGNARRRPRSSLWAWASFAIASSLCVQTGIGSLVTQDPVLCATGGPPSPASRSPDRSAVRHALGEQGLANGRIGGLSLGAKRDTTGVP